MEFNDIKKEIQSFFDQGTVTIVGSGLSCAEGISGMSGLSSKLKQDVPSKLSGENLQGWKAVELSLDEGMDLESALQKNKVSEDTENAILESTYNLIASEDNKIFMDIIENGRKLKFSEYLSYFNTNLYNLTVITTNYDLLIEYACEINCIDYSDSYYGKIIAKHSPINAEQEMLKCKRSGSKISEFYRKHIKLYKPHGSINWKFVNGNLYRMNNINCGIPCIIPPGSNKYEKGYEIPFDYHIGKMSQEIDCAKRIVFIGYGFNDKHLETHLNKLNNKSKPKLIITRTLSSNAKKLIENTENTVAIEQNILDGENCGTKIYIKRNPYILENKNIWDISELLKEVF